MGMREIAIEAMKKRDAGLSKDEINSVIRGNASLLGITVEEDRSNWFSIRLTPTGGVIRHNDQNGYSYSASGTR